MLILSGGTSQLTLCVCGVLAMLLELNVLRLELVVGTGLEGLQLELQYVQLGLQRRQLLSMLSTITRRQPTAGRCLHHLHDFLFHPAI